ncbi:MAG: hypothetical protein B7O98_08020 [Zestosphaera tikiterensis]|uniref:Glycosyl transferase family 1 domain-containing protein n=1 Tax=Zestosphaera tikiterensis TaxID=1973259 RepID=A0A2R7Y2Z7_9CREN|nr:MAG: hypothetical protein B7O98_08020 [Zestosphaera tikiterensis]
MSIDILIVSTYSSKTSAAFRRITFFKSFLCKKSFSVECLMLPLLSIRGVKKPSNLCISSSVPIIATKSILLSSILNMFLSFSIVPYFLILKPRVVVLSVPMYYPLIPVYLASKLCKAKIIVDMRDPWEEVCVHSSAICNKYDRIAVKHVVRKINYAIYRRANVMIAVTKALGAILEKIFNRKVFIVANGADLETFKPIDKEEARRYFQLKENDFIIVYMGTVGTYYRLTEVLNVLKNLKRKLAQKITVKLLVAGTIVDSLHKSFFKAISDPDIIYLGELHLDKLKIILSASDAGLIPRIEDPIFDYAIPAKFYEYIAMGLPVLALCRKESELARLIIKNGLGLVCEAPDVQCIEEALTTLAINHNIYVKLKENAIRYRKYVDRKIGGEILSAIVRRLMQQ